MICSVEYAFNIFEDLEYFLSTNGDSNSQVPVIITKHLQGKSKAKPKLDSLLIWTKDVNPDPPTG